ncbi:hypothetical protein DsansV1_C05g0054671 [Dioscorea sansibarensis]
MTDIILSGLLCVVYVKYDQALIVSIDFGMIHHHEDRMNDRTMTHLFIHVSADSQCNGARMNR